MVASILWIPTPQSPELHAKCAAQSTINRVKRQDAFYVVIIPTLKMNVLQPVRPNALTAKALTIPISHAPPTKLPLHKLHPEKEKHMLRFSKEISLRNT